LGLPGTVVASNPRIDDLRRRLEKDPGSRLFAQLAEELRKDGDLEEAIRVSREGLHKHPAYPSARMTLGRALLDTGDLAAARAEFEIVLKGAPDNILASRFLGECLEGLGDLAGARDRFKATLALAPGDKQVTAHLQDVEAKLKKAATAAAPGAPRGAEEHAQAPIPLSRVDEPMELERRGSEEPPTIAVRSDPAPSPESTMVMTSIPAAPSAPAPAPPATPAPPEEAVEPPPIPLVAAEEDFELERPYDTPPPAPPAPTEAAPAPHTTAPVSTGGEFESSGPAAEFEFDLAPESGAAVPVPEPWQPSPEVAPTVRISEPEPPAEPPIPPPAAAASPTPPPPPIPSPGSAPGPERAIPVAPPLPPPVFAPAPPPPPPPRMEAAPPPPPPVRPLPGPEPAPEADELTSSTLAELYFNQGFTDKAIEVYRQLLQREPGNERGRTRLAELEALERRLKEEEARATPPLGGAPADSASARRRAIERTIARLEGLLTALRKGEE
jgi:tetratricopeptide (TPR) repeat protein